MRPAMGIWRSGGRPLLAHPSIFHANSPAALTKARSVIVESPALARFGRRCNFGSLHITLRLVHSRCTPLHPVSPPKIRPIARRRLLSFRPWADLTRDRARAVCTRTIITKNAALNTFFCRRAGSEPYKPPCSVVQWTPFSTTAGRSAKLLAGVLN